LLFNLFRENENAIFCPVSFTVGDCLFSIGNVSPSLAQGQDLLQGEVVKAIAQKNIQKFSTSSCQDLVVSMA
jgi:hypothetical protein